MSTKIIHPADADELKKTKHVLGTLITWMAQSSASPISVREATDLLNMLAPDIPPAPSDIASGEIG